MHGLSIHKSFKTLEIAAKISSFVAAAFSLLFSCATYAQSSEETFSQMSLQQKVGQVFIWTYSGTEMSPVLAHWLERFQPGSLIVFSHNIKTPAQIAKYNSSLQDFARAKLKAPFFLMIDQEGGMVTRLRTSVPLPSALALGRMHDAKFLENFGKVSAELLHDVGFNFNLAPVLDISNPNKDSFIGNRAFGEDPDNVATLAVAYAQGINDGGMIPTAKHFPGHGGVTQDSHHTVPVKLATYDELADKDFVPFEEFAGGDYPKAVMMAHLALPNVDKSGLPATFSRIIIHDYLREKLKFDGLVITDDLEMGGASVEGDVGERAVKAFLAGNDMLMLAGSPTDQRKAYNAFLAAVNSGRISDARLKESVMRILSFKQKMKLGPFKFDDKKTQTAVAELEKLSRDVLSKNFRQSLMGKTAKWPDLAPETKMLILSADKRFYDSFNNDLRNQAQFFYLTPQTLNAASREIAKSKYKFAIYYASGMQTARWLARLPPKLRGKMIVVNANQAGEVEDQESFISVLNVNSYCPACGGELAQALTSSDLRVPAGGEEPSTRKEPTARQEPATGGQAPIKEESTVVEPPSDNSDLQLDK